MGDQGVRGRLSWAHRPVSSPHAEPAEERERAQEDFLNAILLSLTAERCYIFALLVFERLVVLAAPWGDFPGVETVLEALWARLPNGPSNPVIDATVSHWQLEDSQPGASEEALVVAPRVFNEVRISDWAATAKLARRMFATMTTAAPDHVAPIEWAAESEAFAALRDQQRLDVPALRSRAREVGQQLSDLGMC